MASEGVIRKRVDMDAFFQAVSEIYTTYEADEREPGSNKYEINTRVHRPNMIQDVAARYCELTRCPFDVFPFHDDLVVDAWVGHRK